MSDELEIREHWFTRASAVELVNALQDMLGKTSETQGIALRFEILGGGFRRTHVMAREWKAMSGTCNHEVRISQDDYDSMMECEAVMVLEVETDVGTTVCQAIRWGTYQEMDSLFEGRKVRDVVSMDGGYRVVYGAVYNRCDMIPVADQESPENT